MRVSTLIMCFGLAAANAPTQTWQTIPASLDRVPGNAALSMPLRWSHGVLQVIYDDTIVAPLQGLTLTHLRLRRPTFFDEPGYAASTAQLEIAIGESARAPGVMSGRRDQNGINNEVVVFSAQSVSIPATAAAGQTDHLGATLLEIPLTQPYTVPAGQDLIIEFRALTAPLTILTGQWVDAVWLPGGADVGLATPVGQFGCGSASVAHPMRLDVDPSTPRPAFGTATSMRLVGALADQPVGLLVGLDPLSMQTPGPFGSTVTGFPFLPNCQVWTQWHILIDAGRTTVDGKLSRLITFPTTDMFQGRRVGVQAFVLEIPTPGGLAPPDGAVALSNGVVLSMDTIGVGAKVATAIYTGTAVDAFSFRPPWIGMAPIVGFGH